MSKVVAVVQSNYIPWKGYFDLIRQADEVVLYDDVQYTRRDWRNRNRVKTAHGVQWLTVPVAVKGKYFQKIRETRISEPKWGQDHWRTLCHCYGRAPHFRTIQPVFEEFYRTTATPWLSEVNEQLIRHVCGQFGIGTPITRSADYRLTAEDASARLLDLCAQAGATVYLSGPAARAYLDETIFASAGIQVRYMEYAGYPEYPQLHPPFEHAVTALDLLFIAGPEAGRYLHRGGRQAA